jgi:hypothetical protein
MTEKTKDDVILISHSVHADITEDEMRAAVPDSTVRAVVDIRPARLSLAETLGVDWVLLARDQARQWERDVTPQQRRYPSARLVYFGLAPIPLAIHLGSLTERWPRVGVFLRHHETRRWGYVDGVVPTVRVAGGPNELVRSAEPAIISISTTSAADIDAARAVVGANSAEIEIRTDPFGEDVLATEDAVTGVAHAFRDALALLEKNRPALAEMHLFGAIPVGLAFLLGTYVTATRHARLVTYQYHRSEDPRHVEALRLPLRATVATPLSDDDVAQATALRLVWEAERQKLVNFAATTVDHWCTPLGSAGAPLRVGILGKQQLASATPLSEPIDTTVGEVADGFRFDAGSRKWLLSNGLLAGVRRLIPDDAALARAGRMLLLHEALHHGDQGLNSATAAQIRLAPKVLEELDYAADVWAMLHEFCFSDLVNQPWPAPRASLLSIVETAIATMWAFDLDRELGLLEVRRINRYLIWYANLARLEKATSLEDALAVLAEKPVLDLVGLRVTLRDDRLVARLDRPAGRPLELSLIDRRGRLCRSGDTNGPSVTELASALGAHKGERVREIIRGFVAD